jgi:uncharacterized protein (DUF58 family)
VSETAQAKIHLNSYILPVLIVFLLVLQVLFPYRGWLILLLGFGGAWLFSYLFARSLVKNVRIIREMRFGWAKVGDTLEERFVLVNNGWASATWVEVVDHSNIPGLKANIVTGIESHHSTSWDFPILCTRRGLYTIGPTSLTTGDIFGIFTVHIQNKASTVLLVTPPIFPLPAIQVAGGGRAGEGRPAKRALEQSINVSGVRSYLPGESLHRVHWPTTARRGQMYTKTFDHTPVSDWWIILDLDRKTLYGEGLDSTEETGVTLAASLVDRGLKSGTAVGLVISGAEPAWHIPATGAAQNIKLMQSLSQAAPGSQPIRDILQNASHSLHHQSSLVLITADISASWLEVILLLAQRDIVSTILLLDPESFGGEGSAQPVSNELANLGITCFVITPDLLKLSTLLQEHPNIWQWRTLGTGRVIPLNRTGDTQWKVLS